MIVLVSDYLTIEQYFFGSLAYLKAKTTLYCDVLCTITTQENEKGLTEIT